MEQIKNYLEKHGIKGVKEIVYNPTYEQLFQDEMSPENEGFEKWVCGGIPLTMMMNIERRHGHDKPVIQKALVDLKGKPFKELARQRDKWAKDENYIFPGPIQYFGPAEVTDMTTKTLQYERGRK